MNCEKCNRDWTHFGAKNDLPCPYCGHINNRSAVADISVVNEQVVPDGTPMNVHVPLMGDGPGRIMVEYQKQSPIKPRERREVIIRIGAHHILDMVGLGLRPPAGYFLVPDFPRLPEGCTVRGPWSDPFSESVHFAVEHPSFAVVPEGGTPPEWGSPLEMKWKVVKIDTDNPDVMVFNVSSLPEEARETLRQLVDKLMVGKEPMIVTPRYFPSLNTSGESRM